jgi:hypothetical protein
MEICEVGRSVNVPGSFAPASGFLPSVIEGGRSYEILEMTLVDRPRIGIPKVQDEQRKCDDSEKCHL